ncbi:hypothetical protein AC578_820 [Pseudocercospora eumusae]|uniref:Uncharacterized protein n=1 Tax=Pseudocercospora eumusae TaxID=321146 RepID=A0A139HC34_9PEZI|nr:hypothetical protein AC578_820 [Pseudocercospora eumusae]
MSNHPRTIFLLLLVAFSWIANAEISDFKQLDHRNPGKFGKDAYEIVGDGWHGRQAGQNADDANQAQNSLDLYTIPGELPYLISAVIAQPTAGNTIATPIQNTAEDLLTPSPGMRRRGAPDGPNVGAGRVERGAQTTFVTQVTAALEKEN